MQIIKNYKVSILITILLTLTGCPYPDSELNPTETPIKTDIDTPFVTIVNGLNETLSVINEPGASIRETDISTGQSPNQIIKHSDKIFIINSLSNSVTVYSTKDLQLKDEFSTGTGTNPYKSVIIDGKIYITSYLMHKLLIFDLKGNKINEKNIPTAEINSNTHYPFPQGIAHYQDYLFIACMYSQSNTASKSADKGRVIVYSISSSSITGYIETSAANTNNLAINNNTLYIVSSGSYTNGYDDNGTIETVDFTNADFNQPSAITPVIRSENRSFGAICINQNKLYAGLLSSGKLIAYDISEDTWQVTATKELSGNNGLSFIPDIAYSTTQNRLYLTEFNSNSIYIVNPVTLETYKHHNSTNNPYGDAQFILIME